MKIHRWHNIGNLFEFRSDGLDKTKIVEVEFVKKKKIVFRKTAACEELSIPISTRNYLEPSKDSLRIMNHRAFEYQLTFFFTKNDDESYNVVKVFSFSFI